MNEKHPQPDILIIGAGTAGICAALSAADNGARVTVIEKTSCAGGSMLMSGNTISGAGTSIQENQEIADSPDLHYQDSLAMGEINIPELLRLYVDNAGSTIDWLQREGVKFEEKCVVPVEHAPYSRLRTHILCGAGKGLYNSLAKALERRGVQVLLKTKATQLITDAKKRIIGVKAIDSYSQTKEFYGDSVILTTGGYAANREMVGKYNPRLTEAISFACPSNTGDSITLAQEVAAATTREHMQFISSMPWALETSPGKGILATIWSRLFGAIYVNKEGRRFVNEMQEPLIIAEKLAEQKDTTMFTIHDERMLKTMHQAEKPVILGGFMSKGWSEERFRREAEEGKLIKRAASLRELAEKIEANPEVLENTVTRYNMYVDSGQDQEFGRPNLSVKIDTPFFYAIPTKPYVVSSYGGLNVNSHLQVLDKADNPITGLYAAGMSVGGVHGKRMASGNGLGWATTSGRLAGEIVCEKIDLSHQ